MYVVGKVSVEHWLLGSFQYYSHPKTFTRLNGQDTLLLRRVLKDFRLVMSEGVDIINERGLMLRLNCVFKSSLRYR